MAAPRLLARRRRSTKRRFAGGIEVGGGLVEKDRPRAAGERNGQRDPLALSRGELGHPAIQKRGRGRSHPPPRRQSHLPDRAAAPPRSPGPTVARKSCASGRSRQVAMRWARWPGSRSWIASSSIGDLAADRCRRQPGDQPRNRVQQTGFAGARAARQPHRLAGPDAEINLPQHRDRGSRVANREPGDLESRGRGGDRTSVRHPMD